MIYMIVYMNLRMKNNSISDRMQQELSFIIEDNFYLIYRV